MLKFQQKFVSCNVLSISHRCVKSDTAQKMFDLSIWKCCRHISRSIIVEILFIYVVISSTDLYPTNASYYRLCSVWKAGFPGLAIKDERKTACFARIILLVYRFDSVTFDSSFSLLLENIPFLLLYAYLLYLIISDIFRNCFQTSVQVL